MFETTRWSVVLAARSPDERAAEALASLCEAYREPVLAFVRRQPRLRDQAEDLTQAFFLRLLESRAHAGADPARGRFRSYLLGALRHFLSHEAAAAMAQRRGGGQPPLSLDEDGMVEPAGGDDPEQCFARDWALAVLERALRRLRREAADAGKTALLSAAEPFLLEAPDRAGYAEVADRLGLRRNTFAVAVHRMRARLRELVRAELAETVDSEQALAEEAAAVDRQLDLPPA